MTASPLLPPGLAGHMAETEATGAELGRMTELALTRGARVSHGMLQVRDTLGAST